MFLNFWLLIAFAFFFSFNSLDLFLLLQAYGQSFINDDYFLSLVGACSSLFNAIGRITWGIVADKFSFRVRSLQLHSILNSSHMKEIELIYSNYIIIIKEK